MDYRPKCKMQGYNTLNLGFGNDFLNATPKAQSMEERIDKLDFIEIKNLFCERHCQEKEKTS